MAIDEARKVYLTKVKVVCQFYLIINVLLVLNLTWQCISTSSMPGCMEAVMILAAIANIIIAGLALVGVKKAQRIWFVGIHATALTLAIVLFILSVITMTQEDYPLNDVSNIFRIILLLLLGASTIVGTYWVRKLNPLPKNYHSQMWEYGAALI